MIHPFLEASAVGAGFGLMGASIAKHIDVRSHNRAMAPGQEYYPPGTRNWAMGGAAAGLATYGMFRYGMRSSGAMNSAAQAARQFSRDARAFGTVLRSNKGMGKITGLFKGFFPSVA